jgi:hypothetical protein
MACNARLGEIFFMASDMGTPILWYTLTSFLCRISAEYYLIQFLHYIFVCYVATIITYSRINLLTKLSILFGYYFSFQYSVVARNYILGISILFTLAILHKKLVRVYHSIGVPMSDAIKNISPSLALQAINQVSASSRQGS